MYHCAGFGASNGAMVTNSNLSLVAPVARFDDASFENEGCLICKWFSILLPDVDNPVVCSAFCFGSSLATAVVTSLFRGLVAVDLSLWLLPTPNFLLSSFSKPGCCWP